MKVRSHKSVFFLVALMILALPQPAEAIGLGAVEVRSHLNESLAARISLTGINESEVDNLRVSLAGEESFERAGLKREYLLTKLKFSIQKLTNGSAYIRIKSQEAVREPGLSFIVRVAGNSSSVERRYDILLNLR